MSRDTRNARASSSSKRYHPYCTSSPLVPTPQSNLAKNNQPRVGSSTNDWTEVAAPWSATRLQHQAHRRPLQREPLDPAPPSDLSNGYAWNAYSNAGSPDVHGHPELNVNLVSTNASNSFELVADPAHMTSCAELMTPSLAGASLRQRKRVELVGSRRQSGWTKDFGISKQRVQRPYQAPGNNKTKTGAGAAIEVVNEAAMRSRDAVAEVVRAAVTVRDAITAAPKHSSMLSAHELEDLRCAVKQSERRLEAADEQVNCARCETEYGVLEPIAASRMLNHLREHHPPTKCAVCGMYMLRRDTDYFRRHRRACVVWRALVDCGAAWEWLVAMGLVDEVDRQFFSKSCMRNALSIDGGEEVKRTYLKADLEHHEDINAAHANIASTDDNDVGKDLDHPSRYAEASTGLENSSTKIGDGRLSPTMDWSFFLRQVLGLQDYNELTASEFCELDAMFWTEWRAGVARSWL